MTTTIPPSPSADPCEARIVALLRDHPVLLFMKGTADAPLCGFSATVVHILSRLGVPCVTVNVLEDPEMREAIKRYTDWPTIPQLYIHQTFIGGCDIVRDMYQNGELAAYLKEQGLLPAEAESVK